MPTVNERLRQAAVSHAIHVERYKAGLIRRLLNVLASADADLVRLIERRNVDGLAGKERLEKLLRAVREQVAVGNQRYVEALRGELAGLSAYEIDFQVRSLERALPDGVLASLDIVAPAHGTVYAATMSRPFAGRLLREWAASLAADKFRRVRDAVRMGVVEGETVEQMVRRIRGTRALRYKDGVLEINRRQAQAVVRTAVNHTVTYAREKLYEANADLVKGVQWISTLDDRTTDICQARDGEIYPVDSGPRPPAHFGCRSSTAPVLKSYRELGVDRDEVDAGTRASMDGQVPATQTYGEWLRGQSVSVQNEVLGRTRAQLFRQGGLTVDRFVDSRGHRYTLQELRSREAAAFEAAGL